MSDHHHALAFAVHDLAAAVREASRSPDSRPATKHDLANLEQSIAMKISEIRSAISTASKQNKEALAELGTKIADLNAKVDELTQTAQDPEVTDEQFIADLNSLKADAQALADIVPGSPSDPIGNGSGSVPTTP